MATAGTGNGAMGTAMSAEDIKKNLASMNSELEFVFTDASIHREIQAKIVSTGYDDCRMFSKADCGKGEVGIREYIKDDLKIDPAGGALQRSVTARITIAWESAKKRMNAKQDAEAVQRTEDGPRTIMKNEYVNLCQTFENQKGGKELPEKLLSGQSYLEALLDQLEDGNLVAEGLNEVISTLEDKGAIAGDLKVSKDGRLKMARGTSSAPWPANAESLRYRYKLMAHHWELARLKLPNKPIFTNYEVKETWLQHIEWLLGEDILGYSVKDEEGGAEVSLPWKQFLELEYQLRRKAMHLITHQGLSLVDALEVSRNDKDGGLLQKYLYIPLGMQAGIIAARGTKRQNNGGQGGRPSGEPSGGAPRHTPTKTEPSNGEDFRGWKEGGSKYTPDGKRLKC
jgi:hypothetical protein